MTTSVGTFVPPLRDSIVPVDRIRTNSSDTRDNLRLVAIGDVGTTSPFHVGDEAMLAGLVASIRRAGVAAHWTVLSVDASYDFGDAQVTAVSGLSFRDCETDADREAQLRRLDAVVSTPPELWSTTAPPLWRAALAAIAASDGVVLAGGGNLCRSWPALVFERVAVARAAARAGRPVVMTSQTLGPLDERTRVLVQELLSTCRLIGVREAASHALAGELGAQSDRISLQFDDAIALESVEPADADAVTGGGPFIAVTLHHFTNGPQELDAIRRMANELTSLKELTGAAVVLVPHVGNADGAPSDDVAFAHQIIGAAGEGDLRIAPLRTVQEAVWYSEHAAMVVSSRYHSIVFATGHGTPCLFLYQDRYTRVKGEGALALVGLGEWSIGVSPGPAGLLVAVASELWRRRAEVERHLQELTGRIRASVDANARHVVARLEGTSVPPPAIPHVEKGPAPEGAWKDVAAAIQQKDIAIELVTERAARAEEYAASLSTAIARKDQELLVAHAALRGEQATPTPAAAAEPPTPVHACTIIARNYLPYARVWVKSLRAVHPDAAMTVLVIDGDVDATDAILFRTLSLDVVIPDETERRLMTLIYDVTELSTAVKPWLLRLLMSEGAPAVLFFDPDIQIFGDISSLARLAQMHGIALTPHALAPIPDDGFGITDIAVLQAGVFNLGFIGVGADSLPFLDWWSSRLRRYCVADPANGLFVDQRWLDYVPIMFPHIVVDDPGCNVAYWNLHERTLASEGGQISVNGRPLRFFHFSGFDADVPCLLSRHQGSNPRVLLSESPIVRDLCASYAAALVASGLDGPRLQYAHAMLPGGTPIDLTMRRAFRSAVLQAEQAGQTVPPAPFAWHDLVCWFQAPAPEAPRLSRYLFALYQQRIDLQRAFPMVHGESVAAYLHWVKNDAVAVRTIPAAFHAPTPTSVHQNDHVGEPSHAGLNVAGYFKAELGVGEVARLISTAATANGIPISTVVNDQTISRQRDGFLVSSNGGPYSVTLVCANADETPRALDALPRDMVQDCHRIGFWFWETDQLPPAHARSADYLDEIWVATDYVASAVRAAVTKPVHVCPVPLRVPSATSWPRAHFGLPEGFLFLFSFDFLSSVERKNPIGAIEAFCRAFAPGEGPTLFIKSINGDRARGAREAVRAAARGRQDIVTFDGYLSADDRDALVRTCDAYVSLHRAEGLGLTLAEAMVMGKPTIATGYSGNLAFMSQDNSFLVPWTITGVPSGNAFYPSGGHWAEPDLDVAAQLMRLVYTEQATAKDRGRLGREAVLASLDGARTASFIRERLTAINAARTSARISVIDEAVTVPEEPTVTTAEPDAPAPAPVVSDLRLTQLADAIVAAEHDLAESQRALVAGVPFRAPSRYGWPGQVLRTGVLRLIRPHTELIVRTQDRHVRALQRVLEGLRNRHRADGPASESAEEPVSRQRTDE